MKKLLIASVALSSLFAWSIIYAQEPWRDYGMGPWMMNRGFGLWWLTPFIMIAFWIVVIVGMISLIRWLLRSDRGREMKSEDTAIDILKKRYAKGEISMDDFERMKQDIS